MMLLTTTFLLSYLGFSMQSMLLRDSEFIESESWPNFSRMRGAYSATRERLDAMLEKD